jgi:hypothetical protein
MSPTLPLPRLVLARPVAVVSAVNLHCAEFSEAFLGLFADFDGTM